MDEAGIPFSGRLSEDDFVLLQAELTRRIRFLLLVVPGTGLLLAVYLLAKAGFVFAAFGGLVGGIAFLPVAFWLRTRTMRGLYRRSDVLGRPLEGEVTSVGIEYRTATGSGLLPWSRVERLAEGEGLLVAFDGPRSGRPLLAAWFEDEAAWARVLALARAGISPGGEGR